MNLTKKDASQRPFEYACHEGNYGLRNILSGARADGAGGRAGGEMRRNQMRRRFLVGLGALAVMLASGLGVRP